VVSLGVYVPHEQHLGSGKNHGGKLRLKLLGGLALESLAGPEIRPRLQGLALLARLAVAGDRGLGREALIACLWPKRDERHALHSLSQALHRLKCDAEGRSLIVGTRILRLDSERISSDFGELQAALRANDAERVVSLYGGPLLDGIFFGLGAELDRWIETERRRLTQACAECMRSAAARARRSGDHRAAATWWQQLAALDPLDSAVACELVQALADAGDHAAALREARIHETLLRRELNVEPQARLRDLAARCETALRGQTETAPARGRGDSPERIVFKSARSLTADELCARARQGLQAFTAESFAEGIRYAQQAIDLDPTHAGAHLTLGWLLILSSQVDQEGNPRQRGVEHCQRAAALEPQIAAVSTALAWAAQLDLRFEEAETLALESVRRDAADQFSNYALGWVRLVYGLTRGRWDKCVESVASFATALAMHPGDAFSRMAASSLYTLAGQYDVAESLLKGALETERSPASEIRPIGALPLLGRIYLHLGRRSEARKSLDRPTSEYADAPQLFAPFTNALTLCALGDLERHAGRYDEAVGQYARARELLAPRSTLMGCGYLLVRVETRLASAFRLLRMRREEARHATAANTLNGKRDQASFNWCWGVSEAEMHYDWSVYHASRADSDEMLAALERAAHFGWREVKLLDTEPAFALCRSAETRQFAARVEALAPLPDPFRTNPS
jgi:DNA-binding SARP family transcriptional activator